MTGISATDRDEPTTEASVEPGIPSCSLSREQRDRVRAAIISSHYSWPQARIVVDDGPDALVALAILRASGQISTEHEARAKAALQPTLGLDGSLRYRFRDLVELLATTRPLAEARSQIEARLLQDAGTWPWGRGGH